MRVTASKSGYTNASSTSAATANVLAGTIANVTVPTITGTAQVGQSLTATAGTWTPSGVTTAFQWVAGGVDVSGATASTYAPVAGDVGQGDHGAGHGVQERLHQRERDLDGHRESSLAGTIANVTVPTITGTAQVGQSLTATAGTWTPSGVTTGLPVGGRWRRRLGRHDVDVHAGRR